jgi:[acyl-carrier-protein] S-malonyltransferase
MTQLLQRLVLPTETTTEPLLYARFDGTTKIVPGGAVLQDGREILDRIVAQISNPVRWDLCMTTLASHVSGALEIPPAGTLVGLLKRAVPIIETYALKSAEDVTLAKEFIIRHQDEQNDEEE